MKGWFVTGTDTEVGKTRISVALIEYLRQQGRQVAAMKPIASGCERTETGLKNEDALQLMAHASIQRPYEWVNPYAFEPAIAPHIAAQQNGVTIDIDLIQQRFKQICKQVDMTVVEGAGGWLVPINQQQTMADLAKALELPVILVVEIRLGCINHALLTVAAIQNSGCECKGWIANHRTTQPQSPEIIRTLQQRIPAPCLGSVPVLTRDQDATAFLCGL